MTFESLKRFVILTQHMNFSRAADELYLSQSTLSRQIMELETEMDCSLIIRAGRQIRLTEAGMIFRNYAIDALKAQKQLKMDLQLKQMSPKEKVNLGYTSEGHKRILQMVMEKNSCEISDCHFVRTYPPTLRQWISSGKINCAFMQRAGVRQMEELVSIRKICSCKLSVLVPDTNPLSGYVSLPARFLPALRQMNYLTFNREVEPDLYEHFQKFLERYGAVPYKVITIEDIDSLVLNLKSMNGFTLGASVEPEYEGLKRIPIEVDTPWLDLVFAVRKDAPAIAEQFYYMLIDGLSIFHYAHNA